MSHELKNRNCLLVKLDWLSGVMDYYYRYLRKYVVCLKKQSPQIVLGVHQFENLIGSGILNHSEMEQFIALLGSSFKKIVLPSTIVTIDEILYLKDM